MALFAPLLFGGASSFGATPAMCLAEPELPKLAQAELDHARGHLELAKTTFLGLLNSASHAVAARSAYRLAEIEEQLLWSKPDGHSDIKSILAGVQKARSAFLNVTTHGDAFWSRRAAFRVITLMDEAFLHLQQLARQKMLKANLSPFTVLHSHVLTHTSLMTHIAQLENESRYLEATLLAKLSIEEDKALIEALNNRKREAMSLFFGDFVSPPWAGTLTPGLIVKHNESYLKIGENNEIVSLTRSEAISAMKQSINSFAGSLIFAFSMAQLADEREPLAHELVVSALHSSNRVVRLAGLYAAQRSPSPLLTAKLLDLWPQNARSTPFATAQDFLFGERERLLLALSAHFALGRESTQMILEHSDLPDEQKAWLLQFRRDRTTLAYANNFLHHDSSVVKSHTLKAMRVWRS